MLVNNAGVAHYKQLVDLPAEELGELLRRERLLALTTWAQTAARGMIERGRGAIVNFASLLGFSDAAVLPFFPKLGYLRFDEGLRHHVPAAYWRKGLGGTGVKVQVVCPGVDRTEFHSRQDIDMTNGLEWEAPDVVQASVLALGAQRSCVSPAWRTCRHSHPSRCGSRRRLLQATGHAELAPALSGRVTRAILCLSRARSAAPVVCGNHTRTQTAIPAVAPTDCRLKKSQRSFLLQVHAARNGQ